MTRSLLVATAFVVGVGCASDGNGGTGPGPDPSITISISQTSASVAQSQSASVTATVTRRGDYAGSVVFSVEGAPSGVTGSASDVQTSGGVTTATITISVDASVAPGVYTLTVRASGSGVEATSVSFQLTVAEFVEFTLALNPNTLSIQQGNGGVTQVMIGRVNFTDPIDLSVPDPPFDTSGRVGVTASFDPNPVTADASTLTFSVSQTLSPGQHTLTVLGTAGSSNRTAALTLTVGAPPDYSLALNPTPLSIAQGSSGQTTVTINRTAFDGEVTLTVTGEPAGITTVVDPAATTGTTSLITVTVGAAVAADGYTLTVTGSSSLGDRTVELPLNVTVP